MLSRFGYDLSGRDVVICRGCERNAAGIDEISREIPVSQLVSAYCIQFVDSFMIGRIYAGVVLVVESSQGSADGIAYPSCQFPGLFVEHKVQSVVPSVSL